MSPGASVLLLNGAPAAGGEGAADALQALAQVNYGHFTSLQVRGGAAQGVALHLERLQEGTGALFDADLDLAAVRGWMDRAAALAGGDCSMRVTVFARGFDHRRPLRPVAPDVAVAASAPAPAPGRALRVRSCRFVRAVPHLKHVGTFPLFHHRRQALKAGYDDALFVDGDDGAARVCEGTVWNVGFWDGRSVVWPQGPALRGTAERLLQAGIAAQGASQRTVPVTRDALPGFRAAFACNASGVQPIAAIDAVDYGAPPPRLLDLLGAAAAHAPWERLGG